LHLTIDRRVSTRESRVEAIPSESDSDEAKLLVPGKGSYVTVTLESHPKQSETNIALRLVALDNGSTSRYFIRDAENLVTLQSLGIVPIDGW
jgi:hypothetical protein